MSQPDSQVAQCVVDNIHYDEARKAIVMYATAQNNQKVEAIIKTMEDFTFQPGMDRDKEMAELAEIYHRKYAGTIAYITNDEGFQP
jgi:hypothetical protein